ncbi:MAG TPA: STAS domain-containing protein [Acidobacteriaceae bacterium]|jgi:anti-sigma B factor antagonist
MILLVEIETASPGVAVVRFTGALTLGTSLHTADSQIQKAINQGAPNIILDMAGVPYMDSAGLGALVQASGLARQHGGELRLSGVSERVAELIRMTRTESLLPMDADVDASLKALG